MKTVDGIRLTARREGVERTRDRSFLISTLVTLLILAAVIVVPKLFGSDSNTFDVGLVGAASQRLGPALTSQAAAADVRMRLQSPADAEAEVRSGKLDAAVLDGGELVSKAQPNDRLALIIQAASRTWRAQEGLAARGLSPSEISSTLAPEPLPVRSLEPTDRNATAIARPMVPISSNCNSPTTPMPITLPARSCTGRTVASSTSTTRVAFSSTTPLATPMQ